MKKIIAIVLLLFAFAAPSLGADLERTGNKLPPLVKASLNLAVQESGITLEAEQVVVIDNLEKWMDAKGIPEVEREQYRRNDSFTLQFAAGISAPPFFPVYLRADTAVWKTCLELFQGEPVDRNTAVAVISGQIVHEYRHANPPAAKIAALRELASLELTDQEFQVRWAAIEGMEEVRILQSQLEYLEHLQDRGLFKGRVADKYLRSLAAASVR